MSQFDEYAHYYDLLYRDKDYRGEAGFVEQVMGSYAPQARRILELGCGTGAYGIILAERGFDVVGVDLSDKMITIARQHARNLPAGIARRIRFACGDARSYASPGEKFDVVLALFHVASYQLTNDDLQSMFSTARTNLAPQGVFIFDCWYGPGVLSDRPAVREKRFADDRLAITRVATPTLLPNLNRVDVEFEIRVQDLQTMQSRTISETHRMRYLFRPELEMLAQNAGLKILRSGEWMSNSEPDLSTWYAYFVLGHA